MMNRSTILVARMLGPALLIFGVTVLAGRVDFAGLVTALVSDPALRLFAAAISIILGLVLAVLHNRWECPTAIAITLIGWVLVLRGASLLIGSTDVLNSFRWVIEAPVLPLISGGLMVAIGGWFAFVGFVRKH
jgi:hypothetical protein